MKASKVCGFGNAFVKVKLSAACHRKESLSLAPSEALGAPSPRNNPGLLHRTNPGSGCPNRHLRTPAPPETGDTQASDEGGFHGGVKGNRPNSAAPHNGSNKRGVHSGRGPGQEHGSPAGPAAAAGGGERPAWAPSCHGGVRAAPRRPGPGTASRPPASQAAPRPRCLRRAWHRRGLGEPSEQRERRPGPRLGRRAAGERRTAPAPSTGSPSTAPALGGQRGREGGPGRGAPVAPGTLTQRRPRCPAPGAGLFPGTSAARPGLRRLPDSAGSNLRGWRSDTHREGGAGSDVAFAGPGPASALAPSLAVPPPPCSWRRRRRFLRLLCPHPSVLGGAHGGGEPAMAAACGRHGYGCGARAQPGGGGRAAGIPAPSLRLPGRPRRPADSASPAEAGPLPLLGSGRLAPGSFPLGGRGKPAGGGREPRRNGGREAVWLC